MLNTAIGEFDTVIVASRHTAATGELADGGLNPARRVPVQAERTRDGKLEFAMRIKSLSRRGSQRPRSGLRQRDALLPLVLAAAVLVRGLAHLVGLENIICATPSLA